MIKINEIIDKYTFPEDSEPNYDWLSPYNVRLAIIEYSEILYENIKYLYGNFN